MNLLSPEAQSQLVLNLVDQCSEKLFRVIENYYIKSPYVQQKALMEELGISYSYLKKLEAHGLKRVKLDEKDKTIFYKREDVFKLMDSLAE